MLTRPSREFPRMVVTIFIVSDVPSSSKNSSTVLFTPISSSAESSEITSAVFIILSRKRIRLSSAGQEFLKYAPHCKSVRWTPRFADIIPIDGGKNVGIDRIIDYYGISLDETMAFGDGNNDIEMLEAVGRGVAMKNASLELKSIADDICDDVANDGIYSYCKAIGLI